MGKMGPLSQRLLDQLTPDWQPAENLIQATIPFVPPGQAVRKHDAEIDRRVRMGQAVRSYSYSEQIAIGARELVVAALGSLTHGKHAEAKVEDGVKMVRLRPFTVPPNDADRLAARLDQIFSGKGASLPLSVLMMTAETRKDLVNTIVRALQE